MSNKRNISSFKSALKKQGAKNIKSWNGSARGVVFYLWNAFTDSTPVDTGHARAGWNIALGSPSSRKPKLAEWASGLYLAPIARPSAPPKLVKDLKGATVFVTSSVEYIGDLERGFSGQAPNGIVAINVLQARTLNIKFNQES